VAQKQIGEQAEQKDDQNTAEAGQGNGRCLRRSYVQIVLAAASAIKQELKTRRVSTASWFFGDCFEKPFGAGLEAN